jgi:polysaccharide export outer membrane protein
LLADYFKRRYFTCVKLAGFKYTINGEIGSTGTKTLFQEHVTMEAIANAGDITTTGIESSYIIRKSPTGRHGA